MNPTQDLLEQRVAALEGGIAELVVASGQAAVTYSVLTIAEAGDNIVSSSALYGGTYNLFAHTLPQYGITTRFADHRDPTSFEPLIDAQTQRLPNGNTHITESATSWRFEITPDGEVVWEFVLPWFAAYRRQGGAQHRRRRAELGLPGVPLHGRTTAVARTRLNRCTLSTRTAWERTGAGFGIRWRFSLSEWPTVRKA